MSDRPPVLVSSRVEHLTMWASSDKFSTWALSVFYMRGWPHNIWITTLFYVNVIYESHYLMAILIYWEYLSSSFKMSIDLCPFSHNSRLLPRWTKRIERLAKLQCARAMAIVASKRIGFPCGPIHVLADQSFPTLAINSFTVSGNVS